MTNCVHKTLAAVRAIEDVHMRRSANFKLLCASVLFSIKKARDRAEIGTLKLLIRTRWFYATDRRDKVFALVGLTSDINQSFVDYSKSYEDLMRDLNLMLLEGRIKPTWGNVLDVLSLITREEDDEIAEPSWVVDVFKPQNFEGSYTPVMGGYPSKEPHIQRKPELRFPEEYGPEVSCTQKQACLCTKQFTSVSVFAVLFSIRSLTRLRFRRSCAKAGHNQSEPTTYKTYLLIATGSCAWMQY